MAATITLRFTPDKDKIPYLFVISSTGKPTVSSIYIVKGKGASFRRFYTELEAKNFCHTNAYKKTSPESLTAFNNKKYKLCLKLKLTALMLGEKFDYDEQENFLKKVMINKVANSASERYIKECSKWC